MARWRLTAAHYLNVPGTEYEYKETDRNTGKQARKVFAVPALLNPDDVGDQNYRELGELIVCHEGKGQPRDIIFTNANGTPGEPTPDMEPLDDEAQAISDSLRSKWQHPIESLASNGNDYGAKLVELFQTQIDAMGGIKPTSVKGVDPDAFAKLQAQVAELAETNAALTAQLAKPTARRA